MQPKQQRWSQLPEDADRANSSGYQQLPGGKSGRSPRTWAGARTSPWSQNGSIRDRTSWGDWKASLLQHPQDFIPRRGGDLLHISVMFQLQDVRQESTSEDSWESSEFSFQDLFQSLCRIRALIIMKDLLRPPHILWTAAIRQTFCSIKGTSRSTAASHKLFECWTIDSDMYSTGVLVVLITCNSHTVI